MEVKLKKPQQNINLLWFSYLRMLLSSYQGIGL
jgi:hypothetical protein